MRQDIAVVGGAATIPPKQHRHRTKLSKSKNRYRAVILTALPVEYMAARRHLDQNTVTEQVHSQGTVYEIGVFNGSKADWDICLVEVGAGNAAAAFEAERAIAAFKPAVALFVGIAGGIKDVAIGDIVFATKIYGYESGKAVEGFLPRPNVGESTYALEQRARAEGRKLEWLERLHEFSPNLAPKVFVGPMAAGEKVIASTKSETLVFLKRVYGDSLAVEMEGRGFLSVIRANRQVEAGVIRGVSDLIDDKTAVELTGTQELASANAAAFSFQILDQFDVLESVPEGANSDCQVRYVVLISGQFKEEDVSFAKAAFELLKQRAKDPTMILEKVEPGSIAIHIKGALAGFQRLIVEFTTGNLRKIGERDILKLTFGSIVISADITVKAAESRSKKISYRVAELERENLDSLLPSLLKSAEALTKRIDLSPEELVNESLVRYLSGSRVRPADLNLGVFLFGVMRSIASDYSRKHATDERHFGERVANFTEADFVADTLVELETELSTAETLAFVRAALKDEPIELAVFDAIVAGESSDTEIAQQLKLTPLQVARARAYLRHVVSRLLDDRILIARYQ